MKLICVLILPQGIPYRHEDDADVEQQRPVFQVPDVAAYAAFHLAQGVGLAAVSRHLGPSRDAGFDQVANHIFIDEFRVLLGVLEHVRPRPHDGHVAPEHVDELGQLVDARPAQEIPEPGLARVVPGRLHPVGVGVDAHRTEFDAPERLAVLPAALLQEEHRAARGQFGAYGHENIDEGEQRAEEQARYGDVECPFDKPVRRLPQRLLADVEDRYVAQQFEVHRALHVVAQVGHVEEADEVVFAEIHDREYLFRVTIRREAAVHFVYRVCLQPRQRLVHATQAGGVVRQGVVVVVAEIAEHAVTRAGVVDHFVVYLHRIVLASDDDHAAGVAAVSARDLDHDAAGVAPQHQQNGEHDVERPHQVHRQQPVAPYGLDEHEEPQVAEYDVEYAADDLLVGDDPRGEDHAEPREARDEADVETGEYLQRAGDTGRLRIQRERQYPGQVQ